MKLYDGMLVFINIIKVHAFLYSVQIIKNSVNTQTGVRKFIYHTNVNVRT